MKNPLGAGSVVGSPCITFLLSAFGLTSVITDRYIYIYIYKDQEHKNRRIRNVQNLPGPTNLVCLLVVFATFYDIL